MNRSKHIVQACDSDIIDVVELECSLFGPHEALSHNLLLDVSNSGGRISLYKMNDSLIGYTVGVWEHNSFHILSIGVEQAFRRRGVGLKLLLNEASCAFLHVDEIYAEVRASNLPSLMLFYKAGFQIAKRLKRYYDHPDEDGFVLSLLNPNLID